MTISQDIYTFEWFGGHYAELTSLKFPYDMPELFSFSLDKDRPTQLDFLQATILYLSYLEDEL